MGKGEGLDNNESLPLYFYHLFPFSGISVTRIFAVIILIGVGPRAATSIRVFSLWLHFAIVLLRCNHLLTLCIGSYPLSVTSVKEGNSLMAHEELSPAGSVFTQGWMIGTLDRALGTFVLTLVTLIGLGQPGFDMLHVDWRQALMAALSTTILTIMKSTIAPLVGDSGTTSLLPGGK